MKAFRQILTIIIISTFLVGSMPDRICTSAAVSDYISFVLISDYAITLDIGDSYRLGAFTSTLKKAKWKSSDSAVATVSTGGVVKAKKAGVAVITAKISNAEANCIVTVNETVIKLSDTDLEIQNGETVKLTAVTSNGSKVKWRSSKKSVATVDEKGRVKAAKPGKTTITASADGSKASCTITVLKPTVSIDKTSVKLYRDGTAKLKVSVSSGLPPVFKSSRPSVAEIDEKGVITAVKHGTTTVTATVDGVTKKCSVTVMIPDIALSETDLVLKEGERFKLKAEVSSGNAPSWSSSNPAVAKVDERGMVTAVDRGTAYIYAAEDGAKVRCRVKVEE